MRYGTATNLSFDNKRKSNLRKRDPVLAPFLWWRFQNHKTSIHLFHKSRPKSFLFMVLLKEYKKFEALMSP